MRDFVGTAMAFPAVLFSFALAVVVGYWLLVLIGGVGHGGGHAGGHGGGHGGHGGAAVQHGGSGGHGGGRGVGGVLSAVGLGGVPITVVVSLLVAFAWFSALAGELAGGPGLGGALAGSAAAVAGGWAGARLLVSPLRRLLPQPGPPPSRLDFVGSRCVIRTGRVGPDFGQAEVHAQDGSAALVQVRQSDEDAAGAGNALTAGTTALIYDYDTDGEFFRVMPEVAFD
ncbi:hypothetical protein [Kitasatospora mediocidica]|uniref:hypothetical protein n=1 Tax=Kitasatospora mediocidica TaxID=58352 RepID=UPI00068BD2E3|nr:hypothetical protein [Kitasatospora mediocidica]